MSNSLRIYLGWDPREAQAYAVAVRSIRAHTSSPVDIHPIDLSKLQAGGWYQRPMEFRAGRLWDCISDAPCATEFAISRFFVPWLMEFQRLGVVRRLRHLVSRRHRGTVRPR